MAGRHRKNSTMGKTLRTVVVSTGVITGSLAISGGALASDVGRDPNTGRGSYTCDTDHLKFDACDPDNIGETVEYPAFAGNRPAAAAPQATQPRTSSTNWEAIAQCESSGNPSTNTGNGFFGYLQFTQSTWDEFGGKTFAARADLASVDEQIQVAERVKDGQGIGAWPTCGRLGTTAITEDVSVTRPIVTAIPAIGPSLVAQARTYLGVDYLYGGNTRSGIDCSGLVQQVFRAKGIDVPRTADQQMRATTRITRAQAEAAPGSLVFGVQNGRAHHVGIVTGPGMMIDAQQTGVPVAAHRFYRDNTVFGQVPRQ